MRALRAIMRKEFLHIKRDPRLVGYVLGLPVLILLLFGSALHLKVDDLSVGVYDQDRTYLSMAVQDRLRRDGRLTVVEADSEATVREFLRTGRTHLGLVIPPGFSRRVADNEQTIFTLLVDGSMPTLAQAALYGASVLTSEDATAELTFDDPDHPSGPPRKPPIKINDVILFNPELRDSDFFLPGTIGIVLMLVALALSTGLVREKEEQTIEQLWATPVTRLELIAGKLLPCALITTLDFTVAAVLARLIFTLPFRGSLVAMSALAIAFTFALLALGAFISAVSDRQLQAHFVNVFVFIVSVLLSGFVFPIEAMPRWLRPVAFSLPMTYFVDGIRALVLKGVPALVIVGDFLALAAFTLGFGGLSVALFGKQAA